MAIKKVIKETDQGEPILNEAGQYEYEEIDFPEPIVQPAPETPGQAVELDKSPPISEEQIYGFIKKVVEERMKNTSKPLPTVTPEKLKEVKTKVSNMGFIPGMIRNKGGEN